MTGGEAGSTPWDTEAGPWRIGVETDAGGPNRWAQDRWEQDQGERSAETGKGSPWRLNTDPDTVRRDLSRLVLTLVELVRQLVERQAIRRMDQGDLSDEQVETLGLTLMRLEEAMTELCERFGVSPSDLNLDLGPLGTLLPTDRP
ncbi:gas vesicle protein K [Microbispora sp. GKU 823]|uniref:gas vesicle protein K n=1 Tax=Microbispora sp. GKU 823 TaxID=1652100 RepID=UPI0009A34B7C|nr:gas vesicle protein K [Microbispora sp. GKU 823]